MTSGSVQGGAIRRTLANPNPAQPETEGLLERIDAEIANPSVRFGGIVQRVTLQGAERGRTLRPRTRFWTIGSDF
jgi:hypothetical protein